MKITYAVTVCNEFIEIQRLVHHLLKNKRVHDDIVILYDSKNGNPDIETFLRSHSVNGEFMWHKGEFEGHFANWKNKLNMLCTGDYIFQIDADEIPCTPLLETIPLLLEQNPGVEVYLVPRENIVSGLTDEHIKKWGWKVDEKEWINFPDYQTRLYRRTSEIEWQGKVHERIVGYNTLSVLPQDEQFCLYHHKQIERQEKQNDYYDTI